MREIKFRAWDVDEECFIPPEDFALYADGGQGSFLSFDAGVHEFRDDCIEVVLEQFTGLHDKNGAEIYEGDIVNVLANFFGRECDRQTFIFDGGQFRLSRSHSQGLKHLMEIVGNIHQHPHLLTGG